MANVTYKEYGKPLNCKVCKKAVTPNCISTFPAGGSSAYGVSYMACCNVNKLPNGFRSQIAWKAPALFIARFAEQLILGKKAIFLDGRLDKLRSEEEFLSKYFEV